MYNKLTFFFLFSTLVSANSETGCNAIIDDEPKGCSTENILKTMSSSILNKKEDDSSLIVKQKNIKITKDLFSLNVMHNEHETLIQRVPMKGIDSCPPFCIEPLTIKNVKTVAELETLEFIGKLKEKKAHLMIDVRSHKVYKKETIPGATSLPLSMIKDKSPYQEEVLKLLGAKKLLTASEKSKWYFPDAQSLLIFGQSATSNEASTFIRKLMELGYPASKILYYRGGVLSWKSLGLTLI